jgi:hypothetical protein
MSARVREKDFESYGKYQAEMFFFISSSFFCIMYAFDSIHIEEIRECMYLFVYSNFFLYMYVLYVCCYCLRLFMYITAKKNTMNRVKDREKKLEEQK